MFVFLQYRDTILDQHFGGSIVARFKKSWHDFGSSLVLYYVRVQMMACSRKSWHDMLGSGTQVKHS